MISTTPRSDVCLLVKNIETANLLLGSLDNKALISHIIEKFHPETQFIIAYNEGAELLKQYLEMAHPELKKILIKIKIDKLDQDVGKVFLSQCRWHLKDEFFLIEDPFWWHSHTRLTTRENWFAVSKLPVNVTKLYPSFEIIDHKLIKLKKMSSHTSDKGNNFLGMAFIKEYETFWKNFNNCKNLRQAINQFLAQTNNYSHFFAHWNELEIMAETQPYNLKNIHKVDSKQINLYYNSSDCQQVLEKYERFPFLYAKIGKYSSHALCFELTTGNSLETLLNEKIFSRLLTWLNRYLWSKEVYLVDDIENSATKYYQKLKENLFYKLQSRAKNKADFLPSNSKDELKEILNKVDWDQYKSGHSAYIHGNLLLENIFYDTNSDEFKLIDPAPYFNEHRETGDLYLDMAKLYASLRTVNNDFSTPRLIHIFELFIKSKELKLKKVKELSALLLIESSSKDRVSSISLAKKILSESKSDSNRNIKPSIATHSA